MKKLALIILLCIPLAARAQSVPYSDIVLSGQGRPIAGANVSVCTSPGLTTTAASVTSNIAILTFGSSPITAGFAAGMTLQVAGFSGGDTYYNGGTLSGGVITGGFTILSVTSTTVTYALTHGNASAGTNGTAFQQGNSVTSCAPLASITSDAAGATPITQPGLTTDGLGNYAFYSSPANYMIQFSGASVTLKLKPVVLPISTGANLAFTGNNTHAGTEAYNNTATFNNQVLLGIGSPATPSLAFVGHGAQGMYYNTTTLDVVLVDGLSDTIGIRAGETMLPQTSGLGFYHTTGGAFDGVGKDTGITRPSAGVVCVDTTAIGNCLGTIKAASLNVAGITNSTGLQLFNSSTTCTTGAAVGATCTTAAITLPVAYADTNYRLSCTGLTPTNVPIVETYTKSNTTFTITIAALTAAAATFSSYDCLAGHN